MNDNCNACCKETVNSLETACDDVSNEYENYDINSCNCGFDEEENIFPINPMLGQSYVPIQKMDKTFTPYCGLKNGTIFPELVSPYYPNQSIENIEYLINRNTIGKGCNSSGRR